jgi:hypothetical protein
MSNGRSRWRVVRADRAPLERSRAVTTVLSSSQWDAGRLGIVELGLDDVEDTNCRGRRREGGEGLPSIRRFVRKNLKGRRGVGE